MRSSAAVLALSALVMSAGACASTHKTTSTHSETATAEVLHTKTTSMNTRHAAGVRGGPGAQPVSRHLTATFLKDLDHKRHEPGDPLRGGPDSDDNEILERFGHPTTPTESKALIAVAKRYYAAAAVGNAAKACSMFPPPIRQAIASNFGRFGFHYAHNAKTCQQTMALIFSHLRYALSGPVTAMNVVVKGDQGYVYLGSKTMPAALLTLQRWHNAWMVAEPIAGDMW